MHNLLVIAPENTKPAFVGSASVYLKYIKAAGLTSDECVARIKDALTRGCNVMVSGTITDLTPYQELAEECHLNLVIIENAAFL
jgi:hypothetical protein